MAKCGCLEWVDDKHSAQLPVSRIAPSMEKAITSGNHYNPIFCREEEALIR